MVITYYGKQCFKIQRGDLVLAYNPISKQSKEKPPKFGADITLISLNHPDFNGVESVSYGEREPFVISGPGEYELSGVFVKGFLTEASYNKKTMNNTVYSVSIDGMNVCFLGALHTPELSSSTVEMLDGIDILFVPIGDGNVLSPSDAQKLTTRLEATIVIPMDYGDSKDALGNFLKESGAEQVKPVDKLTIKKRDIETSEGEISVLKSSM